MISHTKRQRGQLADAVVGIDAGKFTHTLVVRPRGGADSKPFTFPVSRKGFDDAAAFIEKAGGQAAPERTLVGIEFAGNYGFTLAHYLNQRGFDIVSVLPVYTKRWKDVAHNQSLKTDSKDALTIVDLAAQGNFVAFPFLEPAYAELRYLVSARQRLVDLKRGAVNRLRTTVHVVFPEFEGVFGRFNQHRTPMAVLHAYPGPQDLLDAPKAKVVKLLKTVSHGQCGAETYAELKKAAEESLGLPSAQGAARQELRLLVERWEMYGRQIEGIEEQMLATLQQLPESPYLLSIPMVAPVTAAIFLGALGNPQAYESSGQILKLAGLSLVEKSSGIHRGKQRISKRGHAALRASAYMLAVRGISRNGLFRKEYDALHARNGGNGTMAIVAVSRSAIKLMFSIARDRRPYTPEPPARHRVAS